MAKKGYKCFPVMEILFSILTGNLGHCGIVRIMARSSEIDVSLHVQQ